MGNLGNGREINSFLSLSLCVASISHWQAIAKRLCCLGSFDHCLGARGATNQGYCTLGFYIGAQGEGLVIDMKFQSENEAYDFYNSYARPAGFSIRKHWKSNSKKDGSLLWRIFCFSCQGEREKYSTKGTPGKPRPQKRFNCNAHLKIEVDKTSGIFLFHRC